MSTELARILVAEDEKTSQIMVRGVLGGLGHSLTFAEDGQQALARASEGDFDLILLDLMMPVMGGLEVLESLKGDPSLKATPVVVVSSKSDINTVVSCVELGAEDYLFKPYEPVLLKARVEACLEKKRLHDLERAHLDQLRAEQERSESLLHNILPASIADRLKAGEKSIAENFPEATILFADIHGFSRFSRGLPAKQVVEQLGRIFSAFDRLAEEHGVEKIKTIGDGYLAAAGLPIPREDHAEAIADLALAMHREADRFASGTEEPFRLRIGINTGPVVAGVIGERRFSYDLWGETVNVASQMETHGLPGCTQVTKALYERLRNGYMLEERGAFYMGGQGEIVTYLLRGKHRP